MRPGKLSPRRARGGWLLAWAALLLACPVAPAPRARPARIVEVHGHRGCRGLRPENTLAGFLHAARLGVDVLELDLGMSQDGVLVVAHDPEVNPKICRPRAPLPARRLRDLPWIAIRSLDCGSLRQAEFPQQATVPGEPMPRFEQILDLLAAHPHLRANVEIKTFPDEPELTWPPGRFARALVSLLRARGMTTRVVVQSFDPRALREVARLDPVILTAALVRRRGEVEPMLATSSARILSPRYTELRVGDVARFQRRGLRVIPWTVNEPAEMRRLIALGVDGLITDRPDLLLGILGR